LFNDESRVQRAGGMPEFVERFFGGRSLPLLDGDAHRARKQQVLGAFRREAIESYLPALQGVIERFLEKLKNGGEFRAPDQFKRLVLEAIARSILSIEQ